MSNAALIAIVGPTASGKSALALRIAATLDAEIVNADAFCLYRGMDIGTAKPTLADRRAVPHHLVDTRDVQDAVDVVDYRAEARAAIEAIQKRGRTALLVGGSGLYVQAVLDDLRFPPTDPQVRQRLEQELLELGPAAMHERLARIDPAAAEVILASNGRRIVRALEVNEVTGESFTATLGPAPEWSPSLRIGWDPGAEHVDRAIAQRVSMMWEAGFVAEVVGLRERLTRARTASRAVGYRQILDALDAGEDPDTAREPTVTATRRLARRQRTWFRRDQRVHWAQSSSQVEQILGTLES
ncbi:MAG: tRNA (adenosine(37)-N6)-dimethylallyltransferase MiaA [Actinobacteria bacterium]|nr:tRNA (adenosine(37)-N6)-dimethylallyltransferase MiaA [Actinomycetota bacterium]HRY09335.1 tRNA (adenosine(37)-N6)-dimethylallyltransferase MiaA [Candidatus Nanopelagicales bacterium]